MAEHYEHDASIDAEASALLELAQAATIQSNNNNKNNNKVINSNIHKTTTSTVLTAPTTKRIRQTRKKQHINQNLDYENKDSKDSASKSAAAAAAAIVRSSRKTNNNIDAAASSSASNGRRASTNARGRNSRSPKAQSARSSISRSGKPDTTNAKSGSNAAVSSSSSSAIGRKRKAVKTPEPDISDYSSSADISSEHDMSDFSSDTDSDLSSIEQSISTRSSHSSSMHREQNQVMVKPKSRSTSTKTQYRKLKLKAALKHEKEKLKNAKRLARQNQEHLRERENDKLIHFQREKELEKSRLENSNKYQSNGGATASTPSPITAAAAELIDSNISDEALEELRTKDLGLYAAHMKKKYDEIKAQQQAAQQQAAQQHLTLTSTTSATRQPFTSKEKTLLELSVKDKAKAIKQYNKLVKKKKKQQFIASEVVGACLPTEIKHPQFYSNTSRPFDIHKQKESQEQQSHNQTSRHPYVTQRYPVTSQQSNAANHPGQVKLKNSIQHQPHHQQQQQQQQQYAGTRAVYADPANRQFYNQEIALHYQPHQQKHSYASVNASTGQVAAGQSHVDARYTTQPPPTVAAPNSDTVNPQQQFNHEAALLEAQALEATYRARQIQTQQKQDHERGSNNTHLVNSIGSINPNGSNGNQTNQHPQAAFHIAAIHSAKQSVIDKSIAAKFRQAILQLQIDAPNEIPLSIRPPIPLYPMPKCQVGARHVAISLFIWNNQHRAVMVDRKLELDKIDLTTSSGLKLAAAAHEFNKGKFIDNVDVKGIHRDIIRDYKSFVNNKHIPESEMKKSFLEKIKEEQLMQQHQHRGSVSLNRPTSASQQAGVYENNPIKNELPVIKREVQLGEHSQQQEMSSQSHNGPNLSVSLSPHSQEHKSHLSITNVNRPSSSNNISKQPHTPSPHHNQSKSAIIHQAPLRDSRSFSDSKKFQAIPQQSQQSHIPAIAQNGSHYQPNHSTQYYQHIPHHPPIELQQSNFYASLPLHQTHMSQPQQAPQLSYYHTQQQNTTHQQRSYNQPPVNSHLSIQSSHSAYANVIPPVVAHAHHSQQQPSLLSHPTAAGHIQMPIHQHQSVQKSQSGSVANSRRISPKKDAWGSVIIADDRKQNNKKQKTNQPPPPPPPQQQQQQHMHTLQTSEYQR